MNIMATNANQGADASAGKDADTKLPDRNAPAGSENSLGAQSVRDGRPSSDDDIVEAMDEVTPGVTDPVAGRPEKSGKKE